MAKFRIRSKPQTVITQFDRGCGAESEYWRTSLRRKLLSYERVMKAEEMRAKKEKAEKRENKDNPNKKKKKRQEVLIFPRPHSANIASRYLRKERREQLKDARARELRLDRPSTAGTMRTRTKLDNLIIPAVDSHGPWRKSVMDSHALTILKHKQRRPATATKRPNKPISLQNYNLFVDDVYCSMYEQPHLFSSGEEEDSPPRPRTRRKPQPIELRGGYSNVFGTFSFKLWVQASDVERDRNAHSEYSRDRNAVCDIRVQVTEHSRQLKRSFHFFHKTFTEEDEPAPRVNRGRHRPLSAPKKKKKRPAYKVRYALAFPLQVIQQDFISKYSEVMRSSDQRKQRVLLELLKLFEGYFKIMLHVSTFKSKRTIALKSFALGGEHADIIGSAKDYKKSQPEMTRWTAMWRNKTSLVAKTHDDDAGLFKISKDTHCVYIKLNAMQIAHKTWLPAEDTVLKEPKIQRAELHREIDGPEDHELDDKWGYNKDELWVYRGLYAEFKVTLVEACNLKLNEENSAKLHQRRRITRRTSSQRNQKQTSRSTKTPPKKSEKSKPATKAGKPSWAVRTKRTQTPTRQARKTVTKKNSLRSTKKSKVDSTPKTKTVLSSDDAADPDDADSSNDPSDDPHSNGVSVESKKSEPKQPHDQIAENPTSEPPSTKVGKEESKRDDEFSSGSSDKWDAAQTNETLLYTYGRGVSEEEKSGKGDGVGVGNISVKKDSNGQSDSDANKDAVDKKAGVNGGGNEKEGKDESEDYEKEVKDESEDDDSFDDDFEDSYDD